MDASYCAWPSLCKEGRHVASQRRARLNVVVHRQPGGVGADPERCPDHRSRAQYRAVPGVVAPITIGRPKSIAAAQQALREQRPVGIVLQRNPEVEDPGPDDLYRIGTVANIVRYIT